MNEIMRTPEATIIGESPRARLPSAWSALIVAWPPQEGYRVETHFFDLLTLAPGLQALYALAIQGGHSPEAVGLPPIGEGPGLWLCRARLCNAHGQMLAMATAARLIHTAQDLENVEIGARERLLDALGLGEGRPEAPAPQKGCPDAEVPAQVVAAVAPGSVVDGAQDRASVRSGSVVDGAQENAAPTGGVSPSLEDRVLAGLRRQIDHQARLRGVIPPVVTTRADAQAALRDLLATC